MARRHLGQVWRKAIGKDPSIDDSEELLSYRTSVFGFIGAFLFCAGWLLTAGMTWWVVLVFLSVPLLSFVGLSRVVAELGLVYVYYRVQPTEFLLKSFGARVLGAASVVVLSLTRGIGGIGKGFVMPAFTQAVKAVDGAVKPRRVALVLSLAIGLGYTLSIADTLYLGYAHEKLGHHDRAEDAYRNTLNLRPDNPRALLRLSTVLIRRKRYDEAQSFLESLTKKYPGYAVAWWNLGVLHRKLGQPQQAQQAWEQALRVEPENERIRSSLMKLSVQLESVSE